MSRRCLRERQRSKMGVQVRTELSSKEDEGGELVARLTGEGDASQLADDKVSVFSLPMCDTTDCWPVTCLRPRAERGACDPP